MCSCILSCAMCRCQALHGGVDALALAAVMQNILTYYKQFQPLVQEDLQKGLAPIEKHLKACLPCPELTKRKLSGVMLMDRARSSQRSLFLRFPSGEHPFVKPPLCSRASQYGWCCRTLWSWQSGRIGATTP